MFLTFYVQDIRGCIVFGKLNKIQMETGGYFGTRVSFTFLQTIFIFPFLEHMHLKFFDFSKTHSLAI
jgi:hypothetical protein